MIESPERGGGRPIFNQRGYEGSSRKHLGGPRESRESFERRGESQTFLRELLFLFKGRSPLLLLAPLSAFDHR